MSVFGELPVYIPPVQAKAFADAVKARALAGMCARDGAIDALWSLKLDTRDIAARLMLPESVVANRLAAIRDGARA